MSLTAVTRPAISRFRSGRSVRRCNGILSGIFAVVAMWEPSACEVFKEPAALQAARVSGGQ